MKTTFIDSSLLQDIGLIKSNAMLFNDFTILSNKKQPICINNDYILLIENLGDKKEIYTMPGYVLTTEGLEIKKALNIFVKNESIIELGNRIKKSQKNKNLICLLYKIRNRTNSDIDYDDSKNFLE